MKYLVLILSLLCYNTLLAQRAIGSNGIMISLAGNRLVFETLDAAKSANLSVNTVIKTLNYNTIGDNGGTSYIVTTDTLNGYPVDGIGVSLLSNGLYLRVYGKDYINANAFGVSHLNNDNTNNIEKAILYASVTTKKITFYPVNDKFYYVNDVINVSTGLHFDGNFIKLKFNSKLRYCLEVGDVNVDISNIYFEGSRDSTQGHYSALFLNLTKQSIIKNITCVYAPIFVGQNRTQDTMNTVHITNCINKNFFSPNNPGSGYIINNCQFVQTDSSYLDRLTGVGSSHGVYGFADRRNVVITSCMFTNLRLDGIKCSGTTGHVNNWVITHNTFDKCGTAITIGGDTETDYPHRGFIISHNIFRNCFGQRAGWTSAETTIRLYACDDVTIDNNLFSYNVYPIVPSYYSYTIRGNASGKKYMSNLKITNNRFYGVDVNNLPTDVDYNGKPIYLVNWNQYSFGELVISGNTFEKGFQLIIQNCANVKINNNVGKGSIFLEAVDCAYVDVIYNTYTSDTDSGIDRCVIYSNISWLWDANNKLIGFTNGKPSGWAIQYNGIIQAKIPISAYSGITFPTKGKPVTGFWYGSAWQSGDYLHLNGVQIDYNIDFTSPATLIDYINSNVSGYTAFEYNDSINIATTNFIVIQRIGVSPVSNIDEILLLRTSSYTAGVSSMEGIRKSSGATDRYLPFRGGGNKNKIVVISPFLNHNSSVLFTGLNNTSVDFLRQHSLYNNIGIVSKPGVDGIKEFEFDTEPLLPYRFVYQIIN